MNSTVQRLDIIREKVRLLRPIDDVLFQKLAEDKDFCEELLQIVLENPSLKIVDVIQQKSIKNLQGRSVILDALCTDESDKFFNIEVQKNDDDNHFKRVRYNASCITANIVDAGECFEKVPDICVVFISMFDVFAKGRTIYHTRHMAEETGDVVEDGFSAVFVNTAIDDGSDIAEYMKCYMQSEVDNKKFPQMTKRMRYFKESEEGGKSMSNVVQEYAKEYAQECLDKISKLSKALHADGRMEELYQALNDEEYKEKLFEEYGI